MRTTLRRPTEADHPAVASVVDQWFGGRRVWPFAGRLWFRHFAGTSWLAAAEGDAIGGFLIGFRSPDRPAEAVIHLLGVDPNRRRRGIGRALVDAFVGDAIAFGARRATAVAWPDDPGAIAFFRATGFQPHEGPGTTRLYGIAAYADYEHPGEDRTLLVRELTGGGIGRELRGR